MRYLLTFLLLTTFSFSQNMNFEEKITELKNKYAPDRRTVIFDVAVNNSVLEGEVSTQSAKDELTSFAKNNSLKDNIILLPSEDLKDQVYAVVNLSVANVRSKPNNHEELATQVLLGMPLKVYKKQRGYYYVQSPDKYLGWLDDDGFKLMTKDEITKWNESKKVVYLKHYGFAYSQADENSIPVSDLVAGNIMKYLNEENDFVKVEYPDGRIAFVEKKSVQDYDEWVKNKSEIHANNLLSYAHTLMGLPYLWGGTSTKGVDCSGFTKTVYLMNGLILPRDASQQVNAGEPVEITDNFENLKPGDLLFFGAKAEGDKKERVTHVGMYIGNLEFIHSSGRVRINSLDKEKDNFSQHRFNTLLRAKRYIGSTDKEMLLKVEDLFKNFNYELN